MFKVYKFYFVIRDVVIVFMGKKIIEVFLVIVTKLVEF